MKICFFGTYDKTYSSNKLILDGLKENNIPVVEINAHIKVTELTTTRAMSWPAITKRIIKKYRIITQIIKNFKAFRETDVIYVGYPGHVDVFPAFIIAKLFGKKLVFNPLLVVYTGFSEEQGILKKKSLLGYTIKNMEKLVYNLCDIVFADTNLQKTFLEKQMNVPSKKIRVLPIGADSKGYQFSEYQNKNGAQLNVVYYGLYSPVHGVEYIIEAARLLKDEHGIKFTMVGSGNTFEANYLKARSLGLNNVFFYPDVFEGKHLEYLQKADIFLGFLKKHPTVDRVIPNKVYQGLALGRVVLTADSHIIREVFENKKNIYLCEPSNAQALKEAILDLKNNPELRAGIARGGYDTYLREFTPKAVVGKMINYLNE